MKLKLSLLLWGCCLSAMAGGDREIEYPAKSNMLGVVGGVFITSNPDMSQYNTKADYVDGGGGLVYDFRKELSKYAAYEIITSGMVASCKTSHAEDDESKIKVTFPMECRFYLGFEHLKMYLGGGFQYNFIWTVKDGEGYYDWFGNYYTKSESDTGAHQLSANVNTGICILGLRSFVHFLLGMKFHFPLVNNAEGTTNYGDSQIDFSKDRTSVVANAGVSFDLGKRCVLMLNYDYPIGNTSMTTVSTGDTRNFFQRKSQSFTLNFMIKLGHP